MITAHEGFSNKEIIWAINPQYGDGNDANDVGCGRSKSRLPNRLVKKSDGSWAGGYHGTAPTWAAVNRFYTENGLPPAKDPDFYLQSEWLTRYYEGLPVRSCRKINWIARKLRMILSSLMLVVNRVTIRGLPMTVVSSICR
ncbi:MAG: hypothetical protein ACLRS8_19175 [Parabacteroides merdae]